MNLWLTYGTRSAAIEDGEAAWDDRTSGAVTCSADSGIYVIGTKSAKMLGASDTVADTVLASEAVTSADLSTYTHLAYWMRSSVVRTAGALKILLDDTANCASPVELMDIESIPVVNQWYRHIVPISTPASCGAIISVGLKGVVAYKNGDITYIDDMVPVVAKSFSFYGIRGLYQPDEVSMYPGSRSTLLDGSDFELISAYKRLITVDMLPITTPADRIFLLNWAKASEKYIVYGADDVRVVLEDPSSFTNEWLSGVENFPKWTLRCVERSARTTDPTSWGYTI